MAPDPTLGPALQTRRTLRGLALREMAEASSSLPLRGGKGCPKHATIVRALEALDLPSNLPRRVWQQVMPGGFPLLRDSRSFARLALPGPPIGGDLTLPLLCVLRAFGPIADPKGIQTRLAPRTPAHFDGRQRRCT